MKLIKTLTLILYFSLGTNSYSLNLYNTIMFIDGASTSGGELSFMWNNLSSGSDWGVGGTASVSNSGKINTGITGVYDFVPLGNGEIITFHSDNTIRRYKSDGLNTWTQVSSLADNLADPDNINQVSRFSPAFDGNDLIYYWGDNGQLHTYSVANNISTDLTSTDALVSFDIWDAGFLEFHNGTLYSNVDNTTANVISINTSTGDFISPIVHTRDVNNLYSDPISGKLLAQFGIGMNSGTRLVYDVDQAGHTLVPITGTLAGFFTHDSTTYSIYHDGSIRQINGTGTNDIETPITDMGIFQDFWKVQGDVAISVPEPLAVTYILLTACFFIFKRKRVSCSDKRS